MTDQTAAERQSIPAERGRGQRPASLVKPQVIYTLAVAAARTLLVPAWVLLVVLAAAETEETTERLPQMAQRILAVAVAVAVLWRRQAAMAVLVSLSFAMQEAERWQYEIRID